MSYRKNISKFPAIFITVSALFVFSAPQVNLFAKDNNSSNTVNPENIITGVDMVLITGYNDSSFWISRYEVTQELYESVMGTNPSYFKGSRLPVEQVSWFNAIEFCNKLSIKGGFNTCYNIEKKNGSYIGGNYRGNSIVTINNNADGFRLPASEEWEYAARSGSSKKYFWGNEMNGDYCWYSENSSNRTHPVGTKKPNGYGIFDIAGNVSEWCFDLHPSPDRLYRVVRDGHYSLSKEYMQHDRSYFKSPEFDFGFTGIRLVKNNK